MVGRDPNPAFRLLRVPGFEREHMPRLMQFALVPWLPRTHGFLPAYGQKCMNLHKQWTIVVRFNLWRSEFCCIALINLIKPGRCDKLFWKRDVMSKLEWKASNETTVFRFQRYDLPTLTTYSAPSSTFLCLPGSIK